MEELIKYLAYSGILTLLLWVPYITARVFIWGLGTFLNNYPDKFPKKEPEEPLWVSRSKRAHLNMVETMPAYLAVMLAAVLAASSNSDILATSIQWSQIFLIARIVHAFVYTIGIPFLRTPSYLISWFAILAIGFSLI